MRCNPAVPFYFKRFHYIINSHEMNILFSVCVDSFQFTDQSYLSRS